MNKEDIDEMVDFVTPRLTTVDGIELIRVLHEKYGLSELDCMRLIRKARLRLEEGRLV